MSKKKRREKKPDTTKQVIETISASLTMLATIATCVAPIVEIWTNQNDEDEED